MSSGSLALHPSLKAQRKLVLSRDEIQEGLHQEAGVLLPFVLSIGHPGFQNDVRGYREAVQF